MEKYDYKNASWIVSQYNDCIKRGRDFLEAVEFSNYKEMHSALLDFGTKLGMLSEWIVKYILYRYDNYEVPVDDAPRFYTLWEQLGRGKCRDRLVRLGFGFDDKKTKINSKTVRDSLSNAPKHSAATDISQRNNCFEFCQEVRKLILNFVSNDKTEPLIPLHTGSSEWEDLFNEAYGFQKGNGYKYILITDRPRCGNALDLFNIPWSMVLNFDEKSDQPGGLYYDLAHSQNEKNIIDSYLITDKIRKRSTALHWVNIATVDDNGERYSDKKLALSVRKKLNAFLASYHKWYAEPVVVVISMNDGDYCRTLKDTVSCISDEYDNKADAKFILLQNTSVDFSYEDVEDSHDFMCFSIGIRQLVAGAQKEIAVAPSFSGAYMMPAKLEDGATLVEIEKEDFLRLCQFAEPVFCGAESEDSEESLAKPVDYYKGYSNLTWKMIASGGVAMDPQIFSDCKKKLEIQCGKAGTPYIKFFYKRGMGGTTIIRLLAFALHNQYPTVLVHSYVRAELADELQKLFSRCNMPLLIFIDSNDLYQEEVEKLREELKSRTISFVLAYLIGYPETKPLGINSALFPSLDKFSPAEQQSMLSVLKTHIHTDSEVARLNAINANRTGEINDDFSPFLLSMYVFEDDFPGIRSYVDNTLRFHELQGPEKAHIPVYENILFAVALASWAGFSVDEQYLIAMNNADLLRKLKASNSPLSPLVSYECRSTGGAFKIRHYQFSKYILQHFSGGDSLHFTALTDRIVKFIKETRVDELRPENEEMVRLLRRLFINRDWDVSNLFGGTNQQRYSSIICKMIDEHRAARISSPDSYDAETDSIIKIYSALTKCYPNELHFHAHLARYYFYTAADFSRGLAEIDKALEIAEDSSTDSNADLALAYHIKGMGYRAKAKEQIGRILRSLDDLKKSAIDVKNAESLIREVLYDFDQVIQQADYNFEQSEKYGGNNAAYALISSCQLHIEVQKLYQQMKKDSAQYGLPAVVDEESSIQNMALLHSKNSELQACYDFFDEESERSIEGSGRERQRKNQLLIQDIEADVVSLTELDADVISFCRQCLSDSTRVNKSHYRQIIAKKQFSAIENSFSTEESQIQLQEIITLYEENIQEDPSNGTDIRNWFNAVRRLNCECDTAMDILESCRDKLETWINKSSSVPRDAYLYRYVVRFLLDYENNSLDSNESRRVLNQMEADIKSHAVDLPTKTNTVFWISCRGYGLNRLISNSDFQRISTPEKLVELELFEGRLPERNSFSGNTAYIMLHEHRVFFRPTAVRGKISAANSGEFVELGIGFSYDGLRSYHDSLRRSERRPISKPHSPGDTAVAIVVKHNNSWVECLLDGEDQPVIIRKDSLPERYNPDNGIWPEKGDVIEVILCETRNYELKGEFFAEITKLPFRAESIKS